MIVTLKVGLSDDASHNSKKFLIWISSSFKKGASDNTISYFDQSFRSSGLWLILARDLGRSGQNKSIDHGEHTGINEFIYSKINLPQK